MARRRSFQPASLPNFARADEILHAAELFWVRAARVSKLQAAMGKSVADAAFLAYLSTDLLRLSEQLVRYRTVHNVSSLSTWVQYTPEQPLPSEQDLAGLAQPDVDADDAMVRINELNARWCRVFEELSERLTSSSGRELFANCRALLDARAASLVSACAQRHES